MTTTTMHFGPEWMRTKQPPSRPNPSPPLASPATGPAPPPGASSYSALVAPAPPPPSDKRDLANPFRYSKDDMLRIYKEGGGKGGLGLEVERWEGIVREVGSDPVCMKDLSESEKKLFAGPLNSEMRRRPSTDYMSLSTAGLGERPKLGHANTAGNSPMRERIGGFMGRRRDSTDQPQLTLPRKLSQSSLQPPLASPRDALPSPRNRMGGAGGFDGVLSDSWAVRRRASEGLLKGAGRTGDPSDSPGEPKTSGIKEEEEEQRSDAQQGAEAGASAAGNGLQDSPHNTAVPATDQQAPPEQGRGNVGGGVPSLTVNTRVQNQGAGGGVGGTPVEQAPAGPPPGIIDVNSIEWQYLDPQGQIQGPFPSSTMQKWYDDGYFIPTLLMRRVSVDKDWISVGELLQIAGSTRVFLTPLPTPLTSGFPRRDALLDGPPNGTFGSPFQPVPTRNLLDQFHNGGIAPDSPSSYSTGRFSNESPDPSAFNGRLGGHMYNEAAPGPRLGFSNMQHGEPQRRATMDDTLDPSLSRPQYTGFAPGRANSIDGLGFAQGNAAESPGPFSPTFQAPGADPAFAAKMRAGHMATPSYGTSDYMAPGYIGPFANGAGLVFQQQHGGQMNQFVAQQQQQQQQQQHQAAGQQSIPFAVQPQQQQQPDAHPVAPIPDAQPVGTPVETRSQHTFSSPSQSPWPPQEPQIRRPGPFEPDFPTTRNTIAHRTVAPAPPIQIQQQPRPAPAPAPASPAVHQNVQNAWGYQASQGIVSDAWSTDTTSLTAANLGQHNRLQEQEERQHKVQKVQQPIVIPESPVPVEGVPARVESAAQPNASPVHAHAQPEVQQPVQKPRRKASAPAVAAGTPSVPTTGPATPAKASAAAASPVVAPKPPSPTHAETKHAWSIDDAHNGKSSGAALSLREIQEMEAKKQEARKAAERERERTRAATAAHSPSLAQDEAQTTMTWGLPTSQVGGRPAPGVHVKEPIALASPPSATTPTLPVWTGVPKATGVKKTMKEIQEEEERRKKLAVKDKESVASTVRRGYADTTVKVGGPQAGGAWTTVGASGKTNAATAAAVAATATAVPPARPTIASVSSTKSVSSGTATPTQASTARNGSIASVARPPAVPAAIKLSPTQKEDAPAAPSHDFVKWLAENLKGLNSSVSMEEITSMLLSFPLDPDPSTLELISDLIYANSTTLDGRRFASEYVNRRKADAKSGAAAGNGAGSKAPLSIADVVKAQPKPVGNEWGGFKVVNKKKKGARA